MGAIRISNGKDHALIVQGSKNSNSKEKKIVKGKKPKSNNEDESSRPIDDSSVKKFKKKGSTSKCSYCNKCHIPQFAKQFYAIEEYYVIFYDKVCN